MSLLIKTYIGIDPGQTGGIAFVNAHYQSAKTFPMPVAGKEIDVFMIKLLCENNITDEPLAMIERYIVCQHKGLHPVLNLDSILVYFMEL